MTDRPTPETAALPQREDSNDHTPRGRRMGAPRDEGSAGQPARPKGATGALIDLDLELMKLLVRRATLVSRIREGRDHAATPSAIQAEKAVRQAFEANALAFSKDPKFTRQLFNLLQDLTVLSKSEAAGKTGYTLFPARKPLDALLTGPVSSRSAQIWMTLAAFLGRPLDMPAVMLSEPVMDTVKALNQMGARISWEQYGASLGRLRADNAVGPRTGGQGVFLGNDPFTLYLLTFLSMHRPGVIRFNGGLALKSTELTGLSHTLPLLGARLANIVPRSKGLPANFESSGAIPHSISVPADLPLDGVSALLLAPLAWNLPVTINLAELPAATATRALAEVEPVLTACGAYVDTHISTLVYTPGPLSLPEEPVLPLDPVLSAYLLALPSFTGGRLGLKGQWPVHQPESDQALGLLSWAGLAVKQTGEGVVSEASAPPFAENRTDSPLSPELIPLFAALAALRMNQGGTAMPLPLPEDDTVSLSARDFFSRLNLTFNDGTLLPAEEKGRAPQSPRKGKPASSAMTWTCPDAYWGMGMALASFFCPGLCLANPASVTALCPPFWPIFNSLPEPRDPADAAEETSPEQGTDHDKPARRRIITS